MSPEGLDAVEQALKDHIDFKSEPKRRVFGELRHPKAGARKFVAFFDGSQRAARADDDVDVQFAGSWALAGQKGLARMKTFYHVKVGLDTQTNAVKVLEAREHAYSDPI